MIRLKMKNYTIHYDANREAAKISALFEYLTGEEILPFNQKQTMEQAKFTYSVLGKAFEK